LYSNKDFFIKKKRRKSRRGFASPESAHSSLYMFTFVRVCVYVLETVDRFRPSLHSR